MRCANAVIFNGEGRELAGRAAQAAIAQQASNAGWKHALSEPRHLRRIVPGR